jgi:hypothetical protein
VLRLTPSIQNKRRRRVGVRIRYHNDLVLSHPESQNVILLKLGIFDLLSRHLHPGIRARLELNFTATTSGETEISLPVNIHAGFP